MKGLARFCRLIVSLVFIYSGFVKLLSPLGTSLVIKEYLMAFHMDFATPAAMVLGIALSATEFLTGVALLLRLRYKMAAWVALILVALFTPLTLYLALFNPIPDCGCFGEAVHLTNWQTFFKNLILLPSVLVIFICRKKVAKYSYPALEWVFVALFALLATAILLHTFLWSPLVEFTDYEVGNEIREAPAEEATQAYETVLLYEKEGEQRTFTLDDLPDSTWTFVDAVTTGGDYSSRASDSDFLIVAPDGSDISAGLLAQDRVQLMTIYHPDKFLDRHGVEGIARVKDAVEAEGVPFVLIAASDMEGLEDLCAVNRADLKLLMTLNRSNGGVTMLSEGTIINKWTYYRASRRDAYFCGDMDADLTLLMAINRQKMSVGIAIVAFILLCIIKFIVFFTKKE